MPKKHTASNKTRKRKGNDLDQIHQNLRPEKRQCLLNQEVDIDLPGNGQFYCIECDRYLIDDQALKCHIKSKVHRQRLKRLREPAYSQREAEEAVGLRTKNSL